MGSHVKNLINHIAQKQQAEILQMNSERNAGFFDTEMEKKRNTMRLNLYQIQDDVDNKKEQLIEEIEARLKQRIETTELFTIRWKVI